MKKKFIFTRVATRDIVTDSFQGLRNIFGFRLRGYEKIVDRHTKQMLEEMDLKYNVDWFQFQIIPMTNGAILISLYGEGEEK